MGSAITDSRQNPSRMPVLGGVEQERIERSVGNIISENERVTHALRVPEGTIRVDDGSENRISCAVVAVATERRLLFLADVEGVGDVDAGSLRYGDVATVEVGPDGDIVIGSTRGPRWELPAPSFDSAARRAVCAHLRWIGEVRSRLVACRNDIRIAAGEIRDHAAAMGWDRASKRYESLRGTLDGLITAVQWTAPIPDAELAPELTGMERTLERACARVAIERAHSKLELAQQLAETGDYDRAPQVLSSVRSEFERAASRTEAIERGDSFRFGEQRELREELDRLAWEMEAVVADPIREAHEARARADDATGTEAVVGHLETALRWFGGVLDLDLGEDDEYLAGDRAELRGEREAVAAELVDCHRELARDARAEGVEREDDGRTKAALEQYTAASAHLERARELATEVRPDSVEGIQRRRREIEQFVESLRETGPEKDTDGSGRDGVQSAVDEVASDDADSSEGADGESGGDQSLIERKVEAIDTHQEIRLHGTLTDGDAGDPTADPSEDGTDPDDAESPEDDPEESLVELTRSILQSDPTEE